ncbi:MAG TPA: hypothetical protein VGV14_07300, partial [Rhodanobacter sp.]|nr:hypothetical protein [Rhodanobacter sp.]
TAPCRETYMASRATGANSAMANAGSTLAHVTAQWQTVIAPWSAWTWSAQQSPAIIGMTCRV